MAPGDYPALFTCADDASNRHQRFYLRLIVAEYLTLFIAAVLSLHFLSGVGFYTTYAFIFVVGLAVLLVRELQKPEQDWYRCRALAESVKTLTWRYVMRATPFQETTAGRGLAARAEFRNQLQEIFDQNRSAAEKITSDWAANAQVTEEMDRVRAMPRAERMAFYIDRRVDDQRGWYAKKAGANRKAAIRWIVISASAYLVAIALSLSRIAIPKWEYWPIEPVIVFAASAIGWMRIKKYNELTAAYTVTAHEVGMIRPLADEVKSDEDFSEFVNDAEMAFSREHTLWIARQSN